MFKSYRTQIQAHDWLIKLIIWFILVNLIGTLVICHKYSKDLISVCIAHWKSYLKARFFNPPHNVCETTCTLIMWIFFIFEKFHVHFFILIQGAMYVDVILVFVSSWNKNDFIKSNVYACYKIKMDGVFCWFLWFLVKREV